LRLWYFVIVLNLKFLDQLERRHCKDTPFFRPFYIGAPKGPFWWGLNKVHFRLGSPINYWYRGPNELVQHFASKGSSLRRNGAARHIISLVCLYRSPIPGGGGRREVFYLFKWKQPAFAEPRGREGGSQHPVVRIFFSEEPLLPLTVFPTTSETMLQNLLSLGNFSACRHKLERRHRYINMVHTQAS
jgi:hypothetical protein